MIEMCAADSSKDDSRAKTGDWPVPMCRIIMYSCCCRYYSKRGLGVVVVQMCDVHDVGPPPVCGIKVRWIFLPLWVNSVPLRSPLKLIPLSF